MTAETIQHELFQRCAADLALSPNNMSILIPDDNPDPTEQQIQQLLNAVEPRGVHPTNQTLLYNFFILGRALHHLGTTAARRMLRKWISKKRTEHTYVAGTRCYELFRIRGTDYIGVAKNITPNRLHNLSRDNFHNLCVCAEMVSMGLNCEYLQGQDS